MAKQDLGTKRLCPNCGAKYYDLNKNPPVCPKCETVFVVATPKSRPVEVVPEPKAEEPAEVKAEKPAVETISLEEADEERSGAKSSAEDDEDDDLEVEGDEDNDTFLEEEDDEDDVTDIIGEVAESDD